MCSQGGGGFGSQEVSGHFKDFCIKAYLALIHAAVFTMGLLDKALFVVIQLFLGRKG